MESFLETRLSQKAVQASAEMIQMQNKHFKNVVSNLEVLAPVLP